MKRGRENKKEKERKETGKGERKEGEAGKKKSKPPGRFFSSEARKKPKCLPAAGVEIFRIVLCT